MQNLREQLKHKGLAASITLRENGSQVRMKFEPGQTTKAIRLNLGPVCVEGVLRLVPVDTSSEHANLKVVLEINPESQRGLIQLPPEEASVPAVAAPAIEAAAPAEEVSAVTEEAVNVVAPAEDSKAERESRPYWGKKKKRY